jgi:micrococcal nuclease
MPLLRRRFRRRPSAAALLGLALLIAIGARWAYVSLYSRQDQAGALSEGPCQVVEVLTGPTLVVRQEHWAASENSVTAVVRRVRLLGIESQSAAREGRADDGPARTIGFVQGATADGEVRLAFDKRRMDRDENFLAYVYVADGLLNEQLVREGLARCYEYPGDSQPIAKRLRAAQQEAKQARRGLWSGGNL